MTSYMNSHHQAMERFDEYRDKKKRGNVTGARRALNEALALERQAAQNVPADREPARSVIFRSAAAMARIAGNMQEVRELVASGLQGSPLEIRQELIDLLPFMDRVLKGAVLLPEQEIVAALEERNSVNNEIPDHEWLGMTEVEYRRYKNDPSQLFRLFHARRYNLSHEDGEQPEASSCLAPRGDHAADVQELITWLSDHRYI